MLFDKANDEISVLLQGVFFLSEVLIKESVRFVLFFILLGEQFAQGLLFEVD